jgi:hypothetical protein
MNSRRATRIATVALAGVAAPAFGAPDYAKWGPVIKASGFKP